MAGLLDFSRGGRSTPQTTARAPFTELGVGSTTSYGGQIGNQDRNPAARGLRRWQTAQDLMVNTSIVAAGLRFYLNIIARPKWSMEPADDSDEAKSYADFAESLLHSTDTSWTRIVRRSGKFKFDGFGFHEWTAKNREDGKIGFQSIEPRAGQTIRRWDLDAHNSVLGIWQANPNGGADIYLPREKLVYLVDDALSDSPEGLGWWRHLIKTNDRMEKYLKLEAIGFERDLAGTPVGRAPYAAIRKAVEQNEISEAEGKALTLGIEQFVNTKSREPDTSLMLDSVAYTNIGGNAERTVSNNLQYGIELLTGKAGSVEELGIAIGRTTWDMALIMGIERLLVGREGAGSLALSEDTSVNLFLNANSTLGDLAEGYDRDLIGPAWALNGFPPEMRPTTKVEDVSFKDVAKLARMLADMASAGAMLSPDDPAIDDMRDLAGLPHQPEMTPARMEMLMPAPPVSTKPGDNPSTNPTDPGNEK